MPFAVCITTKGNGHILEESLRASWTVMPHDGDGMFVVVSADRRGSREGRLLLRLADELGAGMRLVFARSTRGRGRQLAFEAAAAAGATHVIQGCDTDAVIHSPAQEFLQIYDRLYGDRPVLFQLVGWSATRVDFMRTIGGWPDLQVFEDRILWMNASQKGRLIFLAIDTTEHVRHPRRRWLPWRLARQLRFNRVEKRLAREVPGFAGFQLDAGRLGAPEAAAEVQRAEAAVQQYWAARVKRHAV